VEPVGIRRVEGLSSIYETSVDPDSENSAHSFALSLIGYNKSVLEVGCSTGYFTKILVERGCSVVGIEIDPDAAVKAEAWADRVVVGDVDNSDLWNEVKDESFDAVILGDVLEHLRDPLTALRSAAKKLKPSGSIVTSLPNIAHGDVRIALLLGRFRYSDTGLLDRTHMRFFTLESVRELLREAGLVVVETKRVVVPLFQSELGVKRTDVSHKTLDEITVDPEVESYQFVMKSVLDNGLQAVRELETKVNELSDRVHHQKMRIALMRKGIRDDRIMDMHLREHQRYIEALEGHASGLEHNIEILTQSLAASEARYQALLNSKTMRITAPMKRVYGLFRKPAN
jgi:2-polyprenyl-3-methyl-5-hydroxy-6-metoxy-1,4-benzoquinol methylase